MKVSKLANYSLISEIITGLLIHIEYLEDEYKQKVYSIYFNINYISIFEIISYLEKNSDDDIK